MKDHEEGKQRTSPAIEGCVEPDSAISLPNSGPVHGVLIGTLQKLTDNNEAHVSYPGNTFELPLAARSTIPLNASTIGRQVVLMFENGNAGKPIIIGLLQPHTASLDDTAPFAAETAGNASSDAIVMEETMPPADSELIIDGRRIHLQASEQIVLRCGKSSITMTSAGKVIIRGAYVSSKSSGANRIKGGSVQIN